MEGLHSNKATAIKLLVFHHLLSNVSVRAGAYYHYSLWCGFLSQVISSLEKSA